MNIIWIYVMSCVRLSGQPPGLAVLRCKCFNIEQYMQIFQPNFVIPAMPVVTIDFNHFILLHWPWPWVWVTRVVQNKTSWLHFLAHFQLSRMKFDPVLKQFRLNILILFFSEIQWSKGKWMLFYWLRPKEIMVAQIQMFLNQLGSNLVWW